MSQDLSTPQSTQSSTPAQQNQPTQPTAQEVLQALEREFQDRVQDLSTARESLFKCQDQVIAAQEAVFKAFQRFTVDKERYLVDLIGRNQSQSQALSQELSKTKQLCASLTQQVQTKSETQQPNVPQIQSRVDNVSN